jgi:hypothetical protein
LQRRLEIARALAIGPELLLLDEPAAGMNPNEIDLLMEFIQWIRRRVQIDHPADRTSDEAGNGHLRADHGAGFRRNSGRGAAGANPESPQGVGGLFGRGASRMSDAADSLDDLQLEVRDLEVHYDGIRALHGVSFTVRRARSSP